MKSWDRRVINEWGTWLSGLTPWDWFGTFTFSELVTSTAARYWFRRYLGWAEDAVNGWRLQAPCPANGYGYVDTNPLVPRVAIQAFRGDEFDPRGGRLHIHSLIAGVSSLTIHCGTNLSPGEWGRDCCWTHRWPCGYARVFAYDPNLGAAYYVTKYVTKPFGDWELCGF